MSVYTVTQAVQATGVNDTAYHTIPLPNPTQIGDILYCWVLYDVNNVGFSYPNDNWGVTADSGDGSNLNTFPSPTGASYAILYGKSVTSLTGTGADQIVFEENSYGPGAVVTSHWYAFMWVVRGTIPYGGDGNISDYTQSAIFYTNNNDGLYTGMAEVGGFPDPLVGKDGPYLALGLDGLQHHNYSTIDNPATTPYFKSPGDHNPNLVILVYPVHLGPPVGPGGPINLYSIQSVTTTWNADSSFRQFKQVLNGGQLLPSIAANFKAVAAQRYVGNSTLSGPGTNFNERYIQSGLEGKIT